MLDNHISPPRWGKKKAEVISLSPFSDGLVLIQGRGSGPLPGIELDQVVTNNHER